jgi:hypothetical protein
VQIRDTNGGSTLKGGLKGPQEIIRTRADTYMGNARRWAGLLTLYSTLDTRLYRTGIITMKITVLASIISALCLSRMVHAGGTWSWLYTSKFQLFSCTTCECRLTCSAADSDPNKCGHIQQPTAPEEVSPRYDINHDKCLYGEPNRTHFWAPSKISFPELYPDFCLHMSKKDFCQCQDNAVIFQTKGEWWSPPSWAVGCE